MPVRFPSRRALFRADERSTLVRARSLGARRQNGQMLPSALPMHGETKDAIDRRPPATGRIAVVLKGYPRLSETFIAQEIRALEGRGLGLALFSLRHPTDTAVHSVHAEIRASVAYLPEYLHDEP